MCYIVGENKIDYCGVAASSCSLNNQYKVTTGLLIPNNQLDQRGSIAASHILEQGPAERVTMLRPGSTIHIKRRTKPNLKKKLTK